MNLQARKYQLIERVMRSSEKELDKMEALLEEGNLDPEIEQEFSKRAQQSEKDIQEGRIYTIAEARARLDKKLD